MVLYQFISTQHILLGSYQHQNAHLFFALTLVFLSTLKKGAVFRPFMLILILASIVCTGYVHFYFEELLNRRMFNNLPDLIIGVILVIVVLEATRESFGLVLPILCMFFIAYGFFGHYLPGTFRTMDLPTGKLIASLGIGFKGIYGKILSVSANVIFLFVVFGGVLQASKATSFFKEFGKLAGKRVRGGPALSAVVTSSLIGSVTGSVGANIVTSGSFTIPLMKKTGYSPEQAGAIEAAASSGGQIMPPLMGAAAFLMADMLNIPYLRIAAAAIIPALLYYFSLGVYTVLQANKAALPRSKQKIDSKEMIQTALLFFIPLVVLVVFLTQNYSPQTCVFWASISLILASFVRVRTRSSLREWLRGFIKGAVAGSQIGVVCACMGIIVSTLVFTGMGIKIPAAIEIWSHGSLLMSLLICMVISIFLGMGVSTVTIYLLVAMVAAPALIRMGLDPLQAHFFVFFYACFSFITPPVALGALIASGLAGGRYLSTALESSKAGLAGFALPFLIIANPILILQPQAPSTALTGLVSSVLILALLEGLVVGFWIKKPDFYEVFLSFVCLAMFLGQFVSTGWQSFLWFTAGVTLFGTLIFKQWNRRKEFAM